MIEAGLAIMSLIIPPLFDFAKKKFLKPSEDTPEATMAALATTKPEVMGEYLKGQAGLLEAKTKYFNRDVCGIPAQWVVNLRASIRPFGVIIAFFILAVMAYLAFNNYSFSADMKSTVDGVRYACVVIMASWFGDRLSEE